MRAVAAFSSSGRPVPTPPVPLLRIRFGENGDWKGFPMDRTTPEIGGAVANDGNKALWGQRRPNEPHRRNFVPQTARPAEADWD